jgi:hypothetical protein
MADAPLSAPEANATGIDRLTRVSTDATAQEWKTIAAANDVGIDELPGYWLPFT